MRPLIGITAAHRVDENGGKAYDEAYAPNARALERAGGLPVLIPSGLSEETLRGIYERVDAVLLPGGGDVDPVLYHAVRHPETKRIDDARDLAELTLARWAVADDRPLFGICRGHQVVNVALGGTLVQDIPSEITTDLTHDFPREIPRTYRAHDVSIEAGSRLAGIMGATSIKVNSLHHQSVGVPAPVAHVTAYAPDGIVEALEVPDKRFVLSVQWHPEDLQDDVIMQHLFDSFVEAARDYASARH